MLEIGEMLVEAMGAARDYDEETGTEKGEGTWFAITHYIYHIGRTTGNSGFVMKKCFQLFLLLFQKVFILCLLFCFSVRPLCFA